MSTLDHVDTIDGMITSTKIGNIEEIEIEMSEIAIVIFVIEILLDPGIQ